MYLQLRCQIADSTFGKACNLSFFVELEKLCINKWQCSTVGKDFYKVLLILDLILLSCDIPLIFINVTNQKLGICKLIWMHIGAKLKIKNCKEAEHIQIDSHN